MAGSAGAGFERKVRRSLKEIGFRHVDGGPSFTIGGFQVDACGGWDDVLLVIECTQSVSGNASIRNRISEVRGKIAAVRKGFRDSDYYRSYGRFIFILATDNIAHSKSDRAIAALDPRVYLVDYQVFDYYQQLAGLVGKRPALYNLLGELQVDPRDLAVPQVPAFRVQLDKNSVGYLFFSDPHEILKIAYVARRETGRRSSYQRLLKKGRMDKIKKFIEKDGIFPNNIVVAFDSKPQFRTESTADADFPSWLEFGQLVFPKSYRSCWVIDGQHRLYSFGTLDPNPQRQKLAVFAFENLTELRQAGFFIEINKEQEPVSPDLIWDIEGDMRSGTDRGRIANSVKRLNEIPPLKGQIYIPLAGEKKRGQIKISSICSDIEEARLLDDRTRRMPGHMNNPITKGVDLAKRPSRLANALADFLEAIRFALEPAYIDGIVFKPSGITLVIQVYEQILIALQHSPKKHELANFAQAFELAVVEVVGSTSAITSFAKTQMTSYAQRRHVVGQVLANMRALLVDPNFGKYGFDINDPMGDRVAQFERALAEFVFANLKIETLSDLKQRSSKTVWQNAERKLEKMPDQPVHALVSLGEVKELLERKDNASVLVSGFVEPTDGFGQIDIAKGALSAIVSFRNDLKHGRTPRNRRYAVACLDSFQRLLET